MNVEFVASNAWQAGHEKSTYMTMFATPSSGSVGVGVPLGGIAGVVTGTISPSSPTSRMPSLAMLRGPASVWGAGAELTMTSVTMVAIASTPTVTEVGISQRRRRSCFFAFSRAMRAASRAASRRASLVVFSSGTNEILWVGFRKLL